jgi:hypothetical protein
MDSQRSCDTQQLNTLCARRDAIRITAAIEFRRRALTAEPTCDRQKIDVDSFAQSLIRRLGHHVQGHVGVTFLDSRNRLIGTHDVFVGTLRSALVSTRDIVRLALEHHAVGIIVYHNHPSGDPALDEDWSSLRSSSPRHRCWTWTWSTTSSWAVGGTFHFDRVAICNSRVDARKGAAFAAPFSKSIYDLQTPRRGATTHGDHDYNTERL